MVDFTDSSLNERTAKLLEENLKSSQVLYSEILRIKRYILWGRVLALLQLLIILVPVILGFIYLPPLVQNFVDSFSIFSTGQNGATGSNLGEVLNQYKDILNFYR